MHYPGPVKSPETSLNLIFVAGGGAWVKESSIMWRMFLEEAQHPEYSVTSVDGIYSHEGTDTIAPPAHQLEAIRKVIEKSSGHGQTLIISQCLGTTAALMALEEGCDSLRMLAIAPPLPSPGDTLATNRSEAKRSLVDGVLKMTVCKISPDMSFEPDNLRFQNADVPEEYLSQHREFSDFEARLRHQVLIGRAAVCIPLEDWNTASPRSTSSWPRGVLRIPQAGHSLNPVNGRALPLEQALAQQRQNIVNVLRFGEQLVGSATDR